MLLGDLITAVAYDLPVKLVVFDNGRLGMVKLEQEQGGLPEFGTVLHNPDLAAVAAGDRAARRSGSTDPDELDDAVREALAHAGPVLLDVVTNPDEIARAAASRSSTRRWGFAIAKSKEFLVSPESTFSRPHAPAWENWRSVLDVSSKALRVLEQRRARAGPDRSRDHPELLHHRPHRPRQVDAGRPMLQLTGVVDERSARAQYLDRMDIERERGITIKSQAVRMPWTVVDDNDAGAEPGTYVLNMIDTPGHVDFTYEVSRSLEACETAVLLVDAAQGIEAQTLANLYLAIGADLHIIPVLNKIDLPSAQPEKYAAELAGIIGCDPSDVLRVSAKTGVGVRAPAQRDRRPDRRRRSVTPTRRRAR